jgi:hypothetical protein
VIHRGDRLVRSANPETTLAKSRERLRGCDLVNELQIDVENRRPVGLLNDYVVVPNLLK